MNEDQKKVCRFLAKKIEESEERIMERLDELEIPNEDALDEEIEEGEIEEGEIEEGKIDEEFPTEVPDSLDITKRQVPNEDRPDEKKEKKGITGIIKEAFGKK